MALSREIAELIISLDGQIVNLKKDLNTASSDLEKFKKENNRKLLVIEGAWRKHATTLQGEIGRLKKDLSSLSGQLEKHRKKNASITEDIQKNWKGYTAAIVATGFALRRLTKPFGDFTHRMFEVNTLANLGTKNFKALQKEILEMTGRVPQSAKELADALYDIVSAGVAVGDAIPVLEKSAKAAVAGVTTTQTAAKVGLAVINAYGKEVSELDSVYDTLFQTVKQGVITFEEISAGLGSVLPSAVAAGESIEVVAASIATMTKLGIPSAIAMTSLRSGLVKLAAPTDEVRDNMEKMGLTWEGWIPTLQKINELGLDLEGMKNIIPDERAGKAVLSLSQNIELLNSTMREVSNSQNSMQTAYEIMEESPVNQVKQLVNELNRLKIALTSAFAPAILGYMRLVTKEFQILRLLFQGNSVEMIRLIRFINEELPKVGTTQEKINLLFFKRGELMEDLTKMQERLNELQSKSRLSRGELIEVTRTKKEIEEITGRMKLLGAEINKLNSQQIISDEQTEEPGKGKKSNKIGASIQADTKLAIESLKLLKAQSQALLEDLTREFEINQISISEYYEARKQVAQSVYDAEVQAISDLILKYDQENISLNALLKTTKEDTDKKKILNTLRDNENKQRQLRIDLETKEISLKSQLNRLTNEEADKTKSITEAVQSDIDKRLFEIREDSRQKELDAEQAWFEERLEKLKQYGLNYNALYVAHKQSVKAINDKYNEIDEKDVATNLKLQMQAINEISTTLAATLNTFLDTKIKKLETARDRELALVNSTIKGQEAQQKASNRINAEFDRQARALGERKKRLALAEAAINMSKSAISSYSAFADIPYVGPALGFAAATAAIAYGLAQMNDIRNTQFYEDGGAVRGPGGVDKVKARLTAGEFVETKGAVDYYGADIFEAMRQRAIPKEVFSSFTGMTPRTSGRFFQNGGLAVAQQEDQTRNALQINNIVDPDLFGDYLTTEQGQDMVVNVITNRSYEIKTRLSQ